MSDWPALSHFAAAIGDPRFALAIFISVLSGAVRGFSGFGSALIYIPLMSAVYGPQTAAPSFLLIDFATGLAFLSTVWRRAVWTEILPLVVASTATAQAGAWILRHADPTTLRWGIAGLVAVLIPILASGWRYHGRPILAVTLAVGALAGILGGAVQISGPPIVLYWLGSATDIAVVRANFVAYFALFAAVLIFTYQTTGLITADVIALALLIGPLHIAAMWAGGKLFDRASERTYRRAAYVIVLAAALVSLPLFDGWLR